jgi:hypothetical protein
MEKKGMLLCNGGMRQNRFPFWKATRDYYQSTSLYIFVYYFLITDQLFFSLATAFLLPRDGEMLCDYTLHTFFLNPSFSEEYPMPLCIAPVFVIPSLLYVFLSNFL